MEPAELEAFFSLLNIQYVSLLLIEKCFVVLICFCFFRSRKQCLLHISAYSVSLVTILLFPSSSRLVSRLSFVSAILKKMLVCTTDNAFFYVSPVSLLDFIISFLGSWLFISPFFSFCLVISSCSPNFICDPEWAFSQNFSHLEKYLISFFATQTFDS